MFFLFIALFRVLTCEGFLMMIHHELVNFVTKTGGGWFASDGGN